MRGLNGGQPMALEAERSRLNAKGNRPNMFHSRVPRLHRIAEWLTE